MDSKSSVAFPMEPPPAIRRGGAEDRISGLPDELLHTILVRLPSAAAAARTSVLSRRWRGVWAHMPELVLGGSPAPSTPSSALLDSVDAALNSYAAPTLHSLKIDLKGDRCDVTDVHANRIASWLRFASQRVAAKVHLSVENYGSIEGEIALPVCETATEIDLNLWTKIVLRPPPIGSFLALTVLKIACRKMDGGDLGRVVSSAQCPRLRKLEIFVLRLEPVHDVSVHSESLECLEYRATSTGKLEVHAPMLQDINVSRAVEACIVAPKLEKVEWTDSYDPGRHQFVVEGRHLRSLYIMHSTWLGLLISSARLMERFDTVSELTVSLGLHEGIRGYVTFLKEMDRLPVCETLVVYLMVNYHVPAAIILHLLRRCSCIRKLKLCLDQRTPPNISSCTTSDCPCLLPENHRLDDITLDSLEEIQISFFTGSAKQVEFVELLLSRCNTVTTLKRVDFTVPFVPVSSEILEAVQRISSMYDPNSKVQFNVHAREVPERWR